MQLWISPIQCYKTIYWHANISKHSFVYLASASGTFDRHSRCTEFLRDYPGWFKGECAKSTPNEFVGGILMREACPMSCGDRNECSSWKVGGWGFQNWCKSWQCDSFFGGVRLAAACPNSCISGNWTNITTVHVECSLFYAYNFTLLMITCF